MATIDDYLQLIPSQNRHLARFPRVVEAVVGSPLALSEALLKWHEYFDIDTATGDQLDILGEWIGFRRFLRVEITGVYFSWNDTVELGWEVGRFKGRFDPETQMETLGDEDYRRLLKALIRINHWDGSQLALVEYWSEYLGAGNFYALLWADDLDESGTDTWNDGDVWVEFEGSGARLVDNQDMTMSVAVLGTRPVGFDRAMIQLALNFIKPAAVGIREVFTTPSGGAQMFVWDDDQLAYPHFSGWNLGEWVENLNYGKITGLGQDSATSVLD